MAHAVYGVGRWEGRVGNRKQVVPSVRTVWSSYVSKKRQLGYTALVRNQKAVLSRARCSARGFGGMAPQEIFKITHSEIESEGILKNIQL